MKLKEIIEELQKLLEKHGDIEVKVTGSYGASAEVDAVEYNEDYFSSPSVLLRTDIMTG